MRRHQSLQYILIFILAQIAWLSLLGLWIYWYISNYMVYNEASQNTTYRPISAKTNIIALVGGLILLVAVSLGMSLIFARLSIQLKIAQLYDNFIATVTHELKSPLSSIQLYLETLKRQRLPGRKQKEFIQRMIQDAGRLNNLINSILEIAGHEQKKVAHHFEVCDADPTLRSLVKEAVDQFKLPSNAVQITGKVSGKIISDRNALKIVFNNIFDNAIKYSTAKPIILVRFDRMDNNLIVEFRDQGIGIPPKDQKRIFDKFQRIYDRDIPSVKGTGLGLYWVKEIMKYHGGQASVFSEGKNKGSTFRIVLPIYQTIAKHHSKRLLKTTKRSQEQPNSKERGNRV